MSQKIALIAGAGPAGLTAAYELLKYTDVKPIVFEKSNDIGGISKTVNYKGNRIDIGGHRFFSKSTRVMKWWSDVIPLQSHPAKDDKILGRKLNLDKEHGRNPEIEDLVFLQRERLSRIFFLRAFFDYPISLSFKTFNNLGFLRIIKIGISYCWISLFPIKNEKNLEDFFKNRFGDELYQTFFKDYTEKVWGVSCKEIPADWGAQRIKGLSIIKSIVHAVKSFFKKDSSIEQKSTETSLIEKFLYPKLGPGQLWEEVARRVVEMGGEIHMDCDVIGIDVMNSEVSQIKILQNNDNTQHFQKGDYFLSTMPVKELIGSIRDENLSTNVKEIASNLPYRDFITVGILADSLLLHNDTKKTSLGNIVPDNWIYIQERDVKVGRLQIFNNWSPYLVADSEDIWLGMEYFCNEGDELWEMTDDALVKFAISELEQIDIIDGSKVKDTTVIRVPKAYPSYFGAYNSFNKIRKYTDTIGNMYLLGRNGQHRYNNADHSMLTAMHAVENIKNGTTSKENVWEVNIEKDYHEST